MQRAIMLIFFYEVIVKHIKCEDTEFLEYTPSLDPSCEPICRKCVGLSAPRSLFYTYTQNKIAYEKFEQHLLQHSFHFNTVVFKKKKL